jgi:hypothetical protein
MMKCACCKGRGRVPLAKLYANTLAILRRQSRHGKAVVASRDAETFGCSGTALSNRLAWLQRHGFARSKLHGRERQYRAT